MKAIILAAGRGSRMGELTRERPKCLTELAGRPLIEWQLGALAAAGIEAVHVVTGYMHEALQGYGAGQIVNDEWASTNMVVTLLKAKPLIDGPTIVSYSDIVYGGEAVSALARCAAPLAIAYDTQWLALWRQRFARPESDAESFEIDAAGDVTDIGRPVSSATLPRGQYMGLLRVTPESLAWIEALATPEQRAKLDMTKALSQLIAAGKRMAGVPVSGGWCEVDSPSDLEVALRLWRDGKLPLVAPRGKP